MHCRSTSLPFDMDVDAVTPAQWRLPPDAVVPEGAYVAAPLPPDDDARLATLRSYDLLDTQADDHMLSW
jgi:hypothetical protein